jgi:signal recognition particle subunit SRP54
MQLGPLSKVMGMIPGMSEDMFPAGAAEDSNRWFKKMLCMMDSMTEQGGFEIFI